MCSHAAHFKAGPIDCAGPGVVHRGLDYADRMKPLVQAAVCILLSVSPSLFTHTGQLEMTLKAKQWELQL